MNKDTILLEPFHYLAQHKGKEIRSLLISAFGHWLPLEQDQKKWIQDIIEMLHTASLMVIL